MGGDTLSDAEIAAVRTWIDDGAHWDEGGATSAADALAALENTQLPPGARDYWAFSSRYRPTFQSPPVLIIPSIGSLIRRAVMGA